MKVFHAVRALVRSAPRWAVPALVIAAPGIAAAEDEDWVIEQWEIPARKGNRK